ncbi:MAG: hypothetical protein OZ917_03790 [Candidatus Brocadiaceae bacterium]|nr:hypothetical protein [Candidatus Brocadiaceae bacterium]
MADFIQKVLPEFSKSAVGKIGTKLIVSKVERDGNKGATVLEFSSYFNGFRVAWTNSFVHGVLKLCTGFGFIARTNEFIRATLRLKIG